MLAGLVLTLFSLVFSSCDAVNRGSVQVEGYGEVWVISPDWANVKVEENGFTLYGNSRMYFASRPTDGFDADAYWQIPLMDKEFSYSVNVANVGCHCNAAAYFIDMPGNNPGAGDWYCDANFGNNIWCPEYDTYEGNKHTLAGTLHTCDGGNGNWNGCDRSGCQTNIFNVDSNAMCPESRCTINTAMGYRVINTQYYDNMVWSGSLWGGGGIDMGWLDGMTGCGGDCNIDGSSVVFSNFRLVDEGSGPGPTPTDPPPGPTNPPGPGCCPGTESFTDPLCNDPTTDPHGGLGCAACGIKDCRICGGDIYIPCP